jgi:cyclohexanecarboxylate-CoA ligase
MVRRLSESFHSLGHAAVRRERNCGRRSAPRRQGVAVQNACADALNPHPSSTTRLHADGGPAVVYPPTLWALLRQSAAAFPDRPVVADDYGRSLTRPELIHAAEEVAAGLGDRGVNEGSVVSWQLPTVIESIVLLLALARLGAVQNPLIPVLRSREVGFITRQVGTDVLVVPQTWRGFAHGAMARDLAAEGGFSVLELDFGGAPSVGDMRLPTGDPASLLPEPVTVPPGDRVRWVYYSSGTTGEPKGARHTDASIMASGSGMIKNSGFGAGDVYPIAWPLTHIGCGTMLTTALNAGTQLVLFDAFDRESTPRRMAAFSPTWLGTAVPFFRAFIDAQLEQGGAERLFPKAKRGTFGGAPLPYALHDELHQVLGIDVVLGSWGLTEFPIATAARPDDPPEVRRLTVGRPSPGVSVRVGSADGSGVSLSGEGELHLLGPQRLVGYVNPSLDAEAFDAEGWFRTGDLGSIDADGNVRITGRVKDIIIRNAENISALEVEEVIRRHPAVADVALIGLPDSRTGERACAVVVLRSGAELDLVGLVEICSASELARYKYPEQLEIVDALPRDGMGKVRKQELKDRFL